MAENQTISSTKRSPHHRRQIGAFIGILASLMLLLSIVSYSPQDQMMGGVSFSDIWKAITDAGSVKQTNNLMSVIGAMIADWFINSTIGLAVIIVPFLGFVWSFYLLNKKNLRQKITLTNYTIILAILFASSAGLVKQFENNLPDVWSGVVGFFVARVLSNLIGLTGATLLIVGTFFIILTLLADLDYKVTWTKLRESIAAWMEWLREKREVWNVRHNARHEDIQKEHAQETVRIKKPSEELSEQSHTRPLVTPVNPVIKSAPLKPPTQVIPSAAPQSAEQQADSELTIDIREKVLEAEVDYDDRAFETKEDVVEEIDYVFPSIDLLDVHRGSEEVNEEELKANAELLRSKLSDFSVEIDSVSVTPGPVVTLYELVPAAGVKISRIESLQDDIALALKAKGIRIIAPMPGKGTVGVEIPNHNPSLVTIRGIINSAKFRDSKAILPLAMGKTISGEVYVDDLAKMPHLLIAGSTGSGKSVGINTIITSIIYRLHPSDVKFVIIDPKKIELSLFKKLRNHYLAVSPDLDEEIITEPNNAVLVLKSVELEMENRYNRLASAGVRNIADYNERFAAGRLHDTETETIKHRKIPYLIVVIDELADLMLTAAKEVEEPIARLAQLARAVGIHLVVATQRPSVDVITGVIKANFPARLAYQVASKTDSRTILDMNGADQLLGNGDMLYLPSGSPKPHRIQNAFISTDEVERITNHIGKQKGYSSPFKLPSVLEKKRQSNAGGSVSEDELFGEAAHIVVRHQQGSVSLLQRRLKVGYSRAARLIDELEAAGIVGQFDGSKAREVLVETEAELETILKSL
jgi:S-DNA-T family DNA segregation ATPase FtsK/SpoIIIE